MAMRVYHDFVLFAYNVKENEHGELQQFTVRVFESPVGEQQEEEVVELPDEDRGIPDHEHLKMQARELERRTLDSDVEGQMALGDCLAKLLLPKGARDMFRRSLAFLKHPDEGLRLRLRLPKKLSDLPWEYMLVQKVGGERTPSDFLALQPRISIVRHEALEIPATWFEPGERRKILVVMATPEPYKEYPALKHLPDEQRFIKQALLDVDGAVPEYEPNFGEEIGEGPIPSAQASRVVAALREGVDIFHFSGHGEFEKRLGPPGAGVIGAGGIVLADERNQAVRVPADRLLEMIRGHRVRLVVLGACETARRDTVYDWSSVALSLLKGEIPAVVAMQFTVKDPLAALFMGHFYEALVVPHTIDEAVYLGRRAMREATLFPGPDASGWQPDLRDWGAPVLYMRSPGGTIFPPIQDEAARRRAADRSNGRFRLHQASFRWADRGKTAGRDELDDLEGRSEELRLEPTQALLMLRSAVEADTAEMPWIEALRNEKGEHVIRHLDDPEPPRPTGPEETLRTLGLDPATLSDRSREVGPVAWSAVHHEDRFAGRTAALALLALEPTPTEGLGRLERALPTLEGGLRRWRRQAELYGTLADADPEVEKRRDQWGPPGRLGVWLWRVWRRCLRDHQRIIATVAGGALGAGIALGVWRALIALVGRTIWPVYLFVHSYLGALLGLFTALGMSLAEPTLLRGRRETAPRGAVARRAAALGALFFAFGHLVVALLNALNPLVRPWLPVTGALMGLGISVALYNQPRAGRKLGAAGWLLRLGTAALVAALAQGAIFLVGADYEASSISFGANFYRQHYRRYDFIRLWVDSTPGWERPVMIVDTALAGLVLFLGITFGLTAAPRWLAWWRRTTGGDDRLRGTKEGV